MSLAELGAVGQAVVRDKLLPNEAVRGNGVVGTAMMVVCQMAGMGILQLPYTLRQSGWASLGLVVMCAIATNFTGKLLISCCYEGGVRTRQSYAEIGEAAFGALGKNTARVFESATLFGVSALFLILAGKELFELLGRFSNQRWSLIAAAVVLVPLVFLRTLKEMKAVALVGVVATLAVVLAVLVEAVRAQVDGVPADHTGPTQIFILGGLAPAFSGMTLSFAAHAGLPTIEAGMREPAKFGRSLDLGYSLVTAMYLPVAVAGYGVYGDKVFSPILCSLPFTSILPKVAKTLVTAHVILTYPVLMMLFFTEVERLLRIQPEQPLYLLKRTSMRTMGVAATAALAVFVPYFDVMISFVAAVCVVMTVFVMPAAFYLKLKATGPRQSIIPLLVALMGIVGGGIGAVQAGIELVQKVTSNANPNAG